MVFKSIFSKEEIIDYNKELQEANSLHLQGNLKLALSKYQTLYNKFKKEKKCNNLALVINNLISIKQKLNFPFKDLYSELLTIRFRQFLKNEEQYAKDYIYTLIMGVDLLNESKDNLDKAKQLINNYKEKDFYDDIIYRIKELDNKI